MIPTMWAGQFRILAVCPAWGWAELGRAASWHGSSQAQLPMVLCAFPELVHLYELSGHENLKGS